MGKINDLDMSKWKELTDVWTDSLWIIPQRDNSGAHDGHYHGNFVPQIPHQLLMRYTKAGDFVLDPFAGSGTTLIEAQRMGRNSIGIELQPSVAAEAINRIHSESKDGIVADTFEESIQNIAENLVQSLTEYFGLPFIYPMTPRTGTVITQRDALNVRSYPALSGQIVGSVPPQAQLTVYGQFDGWYSIGYGNLAGYVLSDFVQI